jgi:hypothetical protein
MTGKFCPAAGTVNVEGMRALIWPAEVDTSGMGVLFKVTQVPPSVVGYGALATDASPPRFRPKIEIKLPGAKAAR